MPKTNATNLFIFYIVEFAFRAYYLTILKNLFRRKSKMNPQFRTEYSKINNLGSESGDRLNPEVVGLNIAR